LFIGEISNTALMSHKINALVESQISRATSKDSSISPMDKGGVAVADHDAEALD
jgi:hypothetical protein